MVPPYTIKPGRLSLPTTEGHYLWTIHSRENGRTRHEDTRHVFVTAGNDDHTVKPVSARGSLYLVRDEVARLQRVGHSTRSHADTVTDANGTELVADNTFLDQGALDVLSKTQEVTVASADGAIARGTDAMRSAETSSAATTTPETSRTSTDTGAGG